MELGPPAKRIKPVQEDYGFVLKQKSASMDGLHDLLNVGRVEYICENGKTYKYLIYCVSLIT